MENYLIYDQFPYKTVLTIVVFITFNIIQGVGHN